MATLTLDRAAKRVGARITARRVWTHGPATLTTAQAEVPALSAGGDHDVIVIADEDGVFGAHLMYRTARPQLIAGSHGLVPSGWHPAFHERGSRNLQAHLFDWAGTKLDAQVEL